MVFWILTVLVWFFVIWWMWITWHSDLLYTTMGRIISILGEIVAGIFIWFIFAGLGSLGLAYLFTPDYQFKEDTSDELVALSTKDTIEGKFGGNIFASYGYINGVRVISFISKAEDGGLSLGYVDVEDAVIYEGDKNPEMITHHWERENAWIIVGIFDKTETYSLFVPEGSVGQDFTIEP